MLLEEGRSVDAFELSLEIKGLGITKRWNDSLSYLIHGGSCVNNSLFCGIIFHNFDFSYIRITIYSLTEVFGTASAPSFP